MHRRHIAPGIDMIVAVHWDRRLFDRPGSKWQFSCTVAEAHRADEAVVGAA